MKIGKSKNTDLVIIQGDITQSGMDAIVNAANSELEGGGGVDGAIHAAAGSQELYEAAQAAKLTGGWSLVVPAGESVITPGFNLSRVGTKYVIHTVGPIQDVHKNRTLSLLEKCFSTSLLLAEMQEDVRSLAYPLISTGAFGVPIDTFANAAKNTLLSYDFKRLDRIAIYVFSGPGTQRDTLPRLKRILEYTE